MEEVAQVFGLQGEFCQLWGLSSLGVTRSTLYRWKKRFEEDRRPEEGEAEELEVSSGDVLKGSLSGEGD